MKADDFRFCVHTQEVRGQFIFPENSSEPAPITYKGYLNGWAKKYVKTTRRPSPGVCNPAFFSLFVKAVDSNHESLVRNFEIHEFTGVTDMVGEKIFLNDILYDCDDMYRVLVKKIGGSYYVQPLESTDSLYNGIKLLTDKVSYSIIGNKFEGEIDATWELPI